jgi:hypothetical protein
LRVALLLLLACLTAIAAWTVRAVSTNRVHEWRVRGVLRSRRAMHAVARSLERGGEVALTTEPLA